MLHRNRRNPFRRSPKSPFNQDGPNATSLRRGLEWLDWNDGVIPSGAAPPKPAPPNRPAEPAPVSPPPPAPQEPLEKGTKPETATQKELTLPLPPAAETPTENTQTEPAAKPSTDSTGTEPAAPENPDGGPAQDTVSTAAPEPDAEPAAQSEPHLAKCDRETELVAATLANIEEARIETAETRKAIGPDRIRTIDRRRLPRAANPELLDLARHEQKCCICQHPERESIEEGFIHWRRTADLRREFELPNRNCIYRHAHAFGLFGKRNRAMRAGLENIIEESSHCVVTAESVIRAIRAHSCLDQEGRWIEPPRRVIIARETLPRRKQRRRTKQHPVRNEF